MDTRLSKNDRLSFITIHILSRLIQKYQESPSDVDG